MKNSVIGILGFCGLVLASIMPASAQYDTRARAAYMIDLTTGTVLLDKVAICETGAFVENVVVGHWVKKVSFQLGILFLNLALHHEGQIAEGQRDILSVNQPVVILEIKPMASLV